MTFVPQHFTFEVDERGTHELIATGVHRGGVLNGQPGVSRLFPHFASEEELQAWVSKEFPKLAPAQGRHYGDAKGVAWMMGSGAPDPLDDTDY